MKAVVMPTQRAGRAGRESGAQAGGVAAGREPELALVLARELRRAVVADLPADAGHVLGAAEQEQAGLLQADLLLELDRAERRDGLEVAMERGGAHAALAGEILDAERARVVLGDP